MPNMTRTDFITSYPELIRYLIKRGADDIINEIIDIILRTESDDELDNILISVKNIVDISMRKNKVRLITR